RSRQGVTINKINDFLIFGGQGVRHIAQGVQHGTALAQVAQRQFTDHEGMHGYLPCLQPFLQPGIAVAGMLDHHRGIGQSHDVLWGRWRRGAFSFGWLPPRSASLRALSRSISALSASRTRDDFSLSPVKAWALAINSSSRASVVRMGFLLTY